MCVNIWQTHWCQWMYWYNSTMNSADTSALDGANQVVISDSSHNDSGDIALWPSYQLYSIWSPRWLSAYVYPMYSLILCTCSTSIQYVNPTEINIVFMTDTNTSNMDMLTTRRCGNPFGAPLKCPASFLTPQYIDELFQSSMHISLSGMVRLVRPEWYSLHDNKRLQMILFRIFIV